jgi:antirestriction protein ArdC
MVAELGAAFLCAEAGISNAVLPNQAAYVAGWLK